MKSNGQKGFVDYESAKPESVDPAQVALFKSSPKDCGALIAYGWTMAEDLVKLGARSLNAILAEVVRRAADDPGVPAPIRSRLSCSTSSSTSRRGRRAPARPRAGTSSCWPARRRHGSGTSRCPAERRAGSPFPGLLDAPVIALPLADPQAYLDRYSEPDKRASGLGDSTDAWPAPYWTIDTAMAVMTLLLAAEDAGLGALLFGVFEGEAELRDALGIPDGCSCSGRSPSATRRTMTPSRRFGLAAPASARRDHPPRRSGDCVPKLRLIARGRRCSTARPARGGCARWSPTRRARSRSSTATQRAARAAKSWRTVVSAGVK